MIHCHHDSTFVCSGISVHIAVDNAIYSAIMVEDAILLSSLLTRINGTSLRSGA
jgi:hypothetical protein